MNRKKNSSEDRCDYIDDIIPYDAYADSISVKDNNIYFRAEINKSSIDRLVGIIHEVNNKYEQVLSSEFIHAANPKPIYLFITSYGGDLFESFRSLRSIQNSKIPIFTVIDGYAASGATLMSIAGVRRYITKNSYVMIHQLSSFSSTSKYFDMRDEFNNNKLFMNKIYKLYEKNTKMRKSQLRKYLAKDCWWKPSRCIKNGIVDNYYTEENIDKDLDDLYEKIVDDSVENNTNNNSKDSSDSEGDSI